MCACAGLMSDCDAFFCTVMTLFIAGWCFSMLHSSGDTNQASSVSSSPISGDLANDSMLTVGSWQKDVCCVKIMMGQCNIFVSLRIVLLFCTK